MSGYREEREALRARAEGLEQELGHVRSELAQTQETLRQTQQSTPWERLEQLERDLATAQRALHDLKGQMASTARPPPRSSGPAIAAAVVGLVLVGAASSMIFVARRASPPPPPVVHTAPPPTYHEQPTHQQPSTGVVPHGTTPAPAPERITATWKGALVSQSGLGVRPGAACAVEATLVRNHGETEHSVDTLGVQCGGVSVYRSTDELNGISMNRSGVREESGASGKAYLVVYDDTGDRTGARAQISLSSAAGEAHVWRATVPNLDVRIRLDHLSSKVATAPAPLSDQE
ncbi:hypothetical protein [Chondromyces apiculatus]|uniref:PspA n=1 Tax=Chondromyces apiculatus DSM 436 TaxID=1192034 RepID=A0A017T7E8_9BACT|nr:hypothetical protein [Chondromyces apiculatus]EYF05178.1 PspA [Chondromyces apiculatus DSM 436]